MGLSHISSFGFKSPLENHELSNKLFVVRTRRMKCKLFMYRILSKVIGIEECKKLRKGNICIIQKYTRSRDEGEGVEWT